MGSVLPWVMCYVIGASITVGICIRAIVESNAKHWTYTRVAVVCLLWPLTLFVAVGYRLAKEDGEE